ncbi:MAG: PAS domain-containing protein, partial [Limisphaerales bacterium]
MDKQAAQNEIIVKQQIDLLATWSDPCSKRTFGMTETQRTWFHGEEQLTLITDAVPALVSYIDSQCRYQFCNATYREWFGVSENRLIGRHCREVLGEDAWRDIGPYVE